MAPLQGMYHLLHGGSVKREDGKFRLNNLEFS